MSAIYNIYLGFDIYVCSAGAGGGAAPGAPWPRLGPLTGGPGVFASAD